MKVKVFKPVTVTDLVPLYSDWFTLLIVTSGVPVMPWLPVVVTVAVVPLRVIEAIAMAVDVPNADAEISALFVENSLVAAVRADAQLAPEGQ